MDDDLATAAVFGDQTQAAAARLHLEAAGIPAFLADELVAGGIFLWSPAVGGIKLQVPQSRLEEAIRLLDEQLPDEKGTTDWSKVDVGEPVDEELPDDEDSPEATTESAADEVRAEAAFAEPTLREQQADVLYRGWLFGLFLFPVMFFLWWQFIWVASSPDRLSPEYRRRFKIAAFGIIFSTIVWVIVAAAIYLTHSK